MSVAWLMLARLGDKLSQIRGKNETFFMSVRFFSYDAMHLFRGLILVMRSIERLSSRRRIRAEMLIAVFPVPRDRARWLSSESPSTVLIV